MNQGLTQIGQQLLAIWRQLGLNQRITVGFASGAVLVGLLSLGFWTSRPNYSLLYGRLEDAEASKVIAALDEAKVPYEAKSGGSIYVPASDVHRMRMHLAGKGIPRGGEGVGLEIFDKPNVSLSDFVAHANYRRAIQGELSRTVSQIDQVETARVMIVVPENRLLLGTNRKPTASVFVSLRGSGPLPESSVTAIRFLVANSVEGLDAANVSVVDNRGNVLSRNDDPDSTLGLSHGQLRAKRDLEQYLTKKAQGMLEKVLGPGQAVVQVDAAISWNSETRYEEKYDPDGQVMRSSTVTDEETRSGTSTTGGSPGISSNIAGAAGTNNLAGPIPVNSSSSKTKVSENQYEVNRTVSSLMQSAGGIQRLSAAVFIAQRFEGQGSDRAPVPRTTEELEKLKRIVQSAIGIQQGTTTRTDEITLEEISFNEQPMLEIIEKLDWQQKRDLLMDIAQKVLYPSLGLVVLFLFWRSVKRTRNEELPLGLPLGDFAGNTHGHSTNGLNGTNGDDSVVTVEVLNRLIRENPVNMTQAVRSWLVGKEPKAPTHGSDRQ